MVECIEGKFSDLVFQLSEETSGILRTFRRAVKSWSYRYCPKMHRRGHETESKAPVAARDKG